MPTLDASAIRADLQKLSHNPNHVGRPLVVACLEDFDTHATETQFTELWPRYGETFWCLYTSSECSIISLYLDIVPAAQARPEQYIACRARQIGGVA